MPGNANIGVVIAGDHGDTIRNTDALQPCPRWRKFCFEREIDEVAGYRDVIRSLRLHVRHKCIEYVAPMEFLTIARPIEITERAFAGEIAKPRGGQGRKMRIGQVRQCECRHHLHPIGWPAR